MAQTPPGCANRGSPYLDARLASGFVLLNNVAWSLPFYKMAEFDQDDDKVSVFWDKERGLYAASSQNRVRLRIVVEAGRALAPQAA